MSGQCWLAVLEDSGPGKKEYPLEQPWLEGGR